jgi:4-hydroxy-3-polyprenylbenzoate decarboxylase
MDLVRFWRTYMKEAKTIPPLAVESGPLTQNSYSGADIDLLKIPTPRWHEHDGGYYIGTGCMVIMRHPETGWVNYGAYRIQVQGRNAASIMTSKGKHGNLIMRAWHERGEPCPIAVVCGMHPALFMVAGIEIPYGKNEYDAAGRLLGEPAEVILGPKTGLPIPAHAEIAFDGFLPPDYLFYVGTSPGERGWSADGPAMMRGAGNGSPQSASRRSGTGTIRCCLAPCPACRPTTIRSIAAHIGAAQCGISSRRPASLK